VERSDFNALRVVLNNATTTATNTVNDTRASSNHGHTKFLSIIVSLPPKIPKINPNTENKPLNESANAMPNKIPKNIDTTTIDNISNKPVVKKKDKKVNKKFSIIVGEFYSKKTAYNLKKNLKSTNISNHVLKVRKLGNNRFELFAGPYSSINTLKNDYFKLNKYGFEYLEIKQNE